MNQKIVFSWSSGKDSASAFYEMQKVKNYQILSLLTTVTQDYERVSMHGTREVLLDKQAASLGITLHKVFISKERSNIEYEEKMRNALLSIKSEGVESIGFGDILLEDLKKYREDKLSQIGMKAIFPLWKKDTGKLASRFIDLGFRAVVTCIDSKVLKKDFVGRDFDKDFLADLPSGVDPCGENGEFHSFVHDGPIFREPILYKKGEIVLRDKRFYYCDLLAA